MLDNELCTVPRYHLYSHVHQKANRSDDLNYEKKSGLYPPIQVQKEDKKIYLLLNQDLSELDYEIALGPPRKLSTCRF
jgi:hypothetical protein